MALAHMGNRVVVQRNVHSSVIDGLVLSGMRPTFVAPELDPELGIAHGLTPDSLAAALDETPEAVAALVVSPTYFGACADVAALAEVAHSRGVPLVADEAWGAHLHFHPDLPTAALGVRRRPGHLLDPQDRRQPDPGGDAARRPRRPDRRRDRRPLRQPGRDDQPQRPAHRLARRGPAPGLRPRRGAARRGAGGAGEDPRADPGDPRPRRARRADGRPARGRRAGTRCGSGSTSAAPAPAPSGSGKPPSTPPRSTSSSTRATSSSPSSASASRPRRRASGWSRGCARRSPSWRRRRVRRTRSWRRRRPGGSWC